MNIIKIGFGRGLSIILTFVLMRVLLDKLGSEEYGLWLTIFSILSWISLMDFGMGIGLRNKLGEAITEKNIYKAKSLVSTAYILLFILVIIIYLCYLMGLKWIDWSHILGASFIDEMQLNTIINILILTFLFNFVFSLINQISFANQDAVIPSIIPLIVNLIILLITVMLPNQNDDNFKWIAYTYGFITLGVTIFFNFILFKKKYSHIRPTLKHIDFRYSKNLTELGLKFFIVQIAVLIIFSTDNFLVLKYVGPEAVVSYQAVLKIFNTVTMLHTIISTPLWSAYTEAYVSKDYVWIKKVIRKMLYLMLPLSMFIIILIISSKYIINLWLGISVDIVLIILFGIYSLIMMWNNIFAIFLNGISKVNGQLTCSIIGAVLNIPLSIYFAKNMELGVNGILLGSIISLLLTAVFLPLEVYKIIKNMNNN